MSETTITKDAIQTRVYAALEEFGADAGEITNEATFEALDVDSLDLAEVSQVIEEELGVRIGGKDVAAIKTVGDAVDLVVSRAA
jgi:acyl carrier protein